MSTKKVENKGIVNEGLNMALECDKLAKEEITRCLIEDRKVNRKAEGNVVLKNGRETLEKSVSEVTKERGINNNCEECLQHEHSEQWELVDI